MRQLLLNCRGKGITLKPGKFTFAEEKVKYAGYLITSKGVEADPDKISAMMNYRKPGNITELRSFMGMVNQLGDFTKEISSAEFDAVKKVIKSLPMLCHYDSSRGVILYSDASRLNGLGYVLAQVVDGQSNLSNVDQDSYCLQNLDILQLSWNY